MNQITVTVDLTPQNLEILKQLCGVDVKIEMPAFQPAKAEHPLDASPFPEETASKPEEKTISKTDVKAVCLQLSKEGKQELLKAAFAKFGAKKLTEVAESDYPALMEELSHA